MKIKTAKILYLASYTFLFSYHLVWLYLNFAKGGDKRFLNILTVPVLPIGAFYIPFLIIEALALIYLAWYILKIEFREYGFTLNDIIFYLSIIFYTASVGFQTVYTIMHSISNQINHA